MILVGTFVFGVLVGCFIERRRLGLTSWYSSDCCRQPTKNTNQISCVCCRRASRPVTVRSRRLRVSPSRRRQTRSSPSRVTFVPTESRLFIPREARRRRSPFRRSRSRSRRPVRSNSRRSLR